MFKLKRLLIVVSAVCTMVSYAHAGLFLDVTVSVSGSGNDVYVITAISDEAPISSLQINIASDGGYLVQHHLPGGYTTPLDPPPWLCAQWFCVLEDDTHAMFATTEDNLLVVSGWVDTEYLLDVAFTGFLPFQSRAVAQVFLSGGEAVATIGAVSGGEEFTLVALAEGDNSALVPEPGSVALLVMGGILMVRRRK